MGNGRVLFTLTFMAIMVASGFVSPPAVRAQDENWSVSAANWMQYWHDRDSKADSLENRFIVDFNFGDFYTGTWFEVFEPDRPDRSYEKITQRYFGWNADNLNVHLGNFYQVFGRGLTLNAFYDDVIDFDNNLDGVKISALNDFAEFSAFSARGLNLSGDDIQYTVRGASGAVNPIPISSFGFSYIRFKQDDFISMDQSANINMTSFFSEINYGLLEAYGEYAYKRGFDPFGNEADGDGTYANVSISQGIINLLAEYKNYINLIYPNPQGAFNNPPPVSHQGRSLISLEGAPGERGYLLSTLIAPSFDLNFDFSFSESFSRGTFSKRYLAEKFAGVRWQVYSDLVLNYHWDRFDYTGEDEIENYLDGHFYLDRTNTVSLTAFTRRFMTPGAEHYHENYLTLGYTRGNFLQLNVGGSTTSKKFRFDPEHLAFIEVIIRLKGHELIIFNGGERGGLICSSGICQIRPTFEGTRVMLFSRF